MGEGSDICCSIQEMGSISGMKIASVDPGGRTGLVLLELDPTKTMVFNGGKRAGFQDRISSTIVQEAMKDNRLSWRNVCGDELTQVENLYGTCRRSDVVIIEDFQIPANISSRKHEVLSPVRIGFGLALLLKMSKTFNGRVVWQQPTQMGVITDDRLRAWGLWLPGESNKDIRSAMKHLLIYLRGNNG